MIETEKYGYYHATNAELSPPPGDFTPEGCKTGYISWYDFTKEIFRQAAALGYPEYLPEHTPGDSGYDRRVRRLKSQTSL